MIQRLQPRMAIGLVSFFLCFATILPAQIVIDTDGSTAVIDPASSYTIGTAFTVDVYLISPGPGGAPPFHAYGIAIEFNDVAGVLTMAAPAAADPSGIGILAGLLLPTDLAPPVGGVVGAVGPGFVLTPAAFPPGATGPAGAFTMSDGGVGIYDILPFHTILPFPPVGTPILLETLGFTAAGAGVTDVAPIGLFPCPGGFCGPIGAPPPTAAMSPVGVWPGVCELYDSATGVPVCLGVFPGTITVTGPLPIELTTFEALVQQDDIQLSWETATEIENLGFGVEHRSQGADLDEGQLWLELGFVEGHGTTIEAQRYSYIVKDLPPGQHQFRLKQIDIDGSVHFSELVEVELEVPGTHLLSDAYPNPFNPQATFTLTVAETQSMLVTLHDMTGRLVETLYQGELPANSIQRIQIDGTSLSSGLYFYRASGETFTESRQVLLQK